MNTKEFHKNIERYIHGEMQGRELSHFEQRMQMDAGFAEEVRIHQRLHKELGDHQKQEFRQKVQQVIAEKRQTKNDHPDAPEKQNGNFKKRWLLLLTVFAGGLLLWLFFKPSFDNFPSEENKEIPSSNNAGEDESPMPNKKTDSSVTPSKKETKVPPVKKDPPVANKEERSSSSKQPVVEEKKDLIAGPDPSDFVANPYLEPLTRSNTRGKKYQFEITSPKGDTATLEVRNGKKILKIEGQISTEASPLEEKFIYYLYSNKEEDYLNEKPILENPLNLAPVNDTLFSFRINTLPDIPAGLYYYLIALEKQDEPLFVGKLIVVK